MKTPWINTKQSRPKEMTVFKFSISKRQDESKALNSKNIKEDHSETGNNISELDTASKNNPDEEANNSFKLAEFVDEMKENTHAKLTDGVHMYEQGKVCYLTKNSPFSIHVEIDDFLHNPICGDIAQNTFEFHELSHQKAPEMDTKLLHTTTYYPEQPDCRLVCSEIHEMVFLTNAQNDNRHHKGNHYKSIVVPLHDPHATETEESNPGSYVHIRVPVVLGEYKIEVGLEENIAFKEEVMRVKGISKEIILTNFRLVPTFFSPSLNNGTRTILKGNLLIEGYIDQKIEYSAFHNRNKDSTTPMTHLSQKIVAELIVHILQVQKVRVKR